MACDYDGCLYKSSQEHRSADPNKCVFHAEVDKKGINDSEFGRLLARHIARQHFDFSGFILHLYFDFPSYLPVEKSIEKEVIFEDCKFLGQLEKDIRFVENDNETAKHMDFSASFNDVTYKYGLQFKNCEFINAVNLQYCKVHGKQFLILNSKFEGDVFFNNSVFKNCSFTINSEKGSTIFHNKVYIHDLKFNNELEDFKNSFTISKTEFKQGVILTNSIIKTLRFYFNEVILKNDYAQLNKITIDSPTILFTNSIFKSLINNFKGTKLTGRTISFENSTFYFSTSFEDAQFNKSEDISLSINSFRNMDFLGKDVTFQKTIFNCNVADFENSLFHSNVSFNDAKFLDGVKFTKCKFTQFVYKRDVEKKLTTNTEKPSDKDVKAEFMKTQFDGEFTDFTDSEFSCNSITIKDSKFKSDILFDKNIFYNKFCFTFSDNYLDEQSNFYFKRPSIKSKKNEVIFVIENIKFIPFQTTFEDIFTIIPKRRDIIKGKDFDFVILFRNCVLKEVYFINDQLSNFSFYRSEFVSANFVTLDLDFEHGKSYKVFKYYRDHILFEEIFYTKYNRKDTVYREYRDKYKFDINFGFTEIADLYRKMKTNLDGVKDYQRAGSFYYSEFEMKRLRFDEPEGNETKFQLAGKKIKYIFYSLYKFFAGYGERPSWSFTFFLLILLTISFINLYLGINISNYKFQYYFLWEENVKFNLCLLIDDYFKSIAFSLTRIIPIDKSQFNSLDSKGTTWNIFFSIILIGFSLMAVVGFKRHFRRF